MPSPRRRTGSRRNFAPWVLLALLLVAVGGFIAGKAALDAYLRSERFRAFVSLKTGETLKGEAHFEPFQFSGSSFYTDSIEARGSEASSFSNLRLDHIR